MTDRRATTKSIVSIAEDVTITPVMSTAQKNPVAGSTRISSQQVMTAFHCMTGGETKEGQTTQWMIAKTVTKEEDTIDTKIEIGPSMRTSQIRPRTLVASGRMEGRKMPTFASRHVNVVTEHILVTLIEMERHRSNVPSHRVRTRTIGPDGSNSSNLERRRRI